VHIRRLVKAGLASHTVSLPTNWLKKNKLSKGDVIYLIEEDDNTLRIRTDMKEADKPGKEITIITDKKSIDSIQREITSAYLNNYSKIRIAGNDIRKKSKEVRRILHDFVALEIAEQTPEHIIAKDMLNLKHKVDQGAHYIITQMFFDFNYYKNFVEKARDVGITVPILPGIKPISTISQLTSIPRYFSVSIPNHIVEAMENARTAETIRKAGITKIAELCKQLIDYKVPGLHIYTMGRGVATRDLLKILFG